ncbi:MAG: hotdog domain-containing protein [Cytophagales bacterium]|nr:hotdog domain-containing protein [Cytophagales bacterium]
MATFHGEVLHRVYSTFALARDFEWSSRLFFLEMKEADEEGVGTFLSIEHKSPAREGEEVIITATIEEVKNNELVCSIEAVCGKRLIAKGKDRAENVYVKERLKHYVNYTVEYQ